MEDKNVDKEIKASLVKNTDNATLKKEDIWRNIEIKLALDEPEMEEKTMEFEPRSRKKTAKKQRKSKGWLTGTIAAAVLLGIFATSTDTGEAFVSNIKEYFAPEKAVIEEIEGIQEEKEVILKESEAGYIIYIDEERYKLIEEDGVDKIVFKEQLDERFPEVSMSINQVSNKEPEVVAEEIYDELKDTFTKVDDITTVNDPITSILVSAIDGNEWNSPVTKVYILSNEKEGSFIIKQKYFLEAAEGHGARFHQMLKEFKIVENTEE